jgi:hypothetical protein
LGRAWMPLRRAEKPQSDALPQGVRDGGLPLWLEASTQPEAGLRIFRIKRKRLLIPKLRAVIPAFLPFKFWG